MSSSQLDLHLSHKPNTIKAVVSIYGVFDWGLSDSEDSKRFRKFLSSVITKTPEEDYPDQFKHGSPAYWWGKIELYRALAQFKNLSLSCLRKKKGGAKGHSDLNCSGDVR